MRNKYFGKSLYCKHFNIKHVPITVSDAVETKTRDSSVFEGQCPLGRPVGEEETAEDTAVQ